MKVVLLDNVRGLGRIGDTKNVADGYAKNFLIPRKLARPAHSFLVDQIEALKKRAEAQIVQEVAEAKKVVEKLAKEDFVLEIKGKANKEGGLYAAIGADQITKALKKEKGFAVDSESVKIQNPIKSVGDHTVLLDFGNDVKTELKLRVQP